MKILYESTVLGMGQTIERAKTGIFRVIESVLLELLKRDDIKVDLTSVQEIQPYKDLVSYVNDYKLEEGKGRELVFKATKIMMGEIRINAFCKLSTGPFLNPKKLGDMYRLCKSTAILMTSSQKSSLSEYGYDIFHSPYHPMPLGIIADKSIKKFWTSYDLIPILFPGFFLQDTIEEIKNSLRRLNRDTWILCISESTKNDLLNYMGSKVDPNKVIVTPLAASPEFYKVEDKNQIRNVLTKYNIPTGNPYILSLCTLEPRKNIVQIIKAFVELVQSEKINDLNLVLAGTKGWKFDTIFNEIKHIEALKNRIFTTGYIADGDQAALYSGAQMFVYPSLYEGFGLPPLEAMQCGIPVITSNNSSLPEVVGDAGIMVDATDLSSLTHSMLNLHKNNVLRDEYATKALIRSKLFNWHKTANLTINAYKKSLT